jgi:hypothetical protein
MESQSDRIEIDGVTLTVLESADYMPQDAD